MAHFNRVRPQGLWISFGNLYASEMEVFDATLVKAINGDEGGTWTPTGQIVLGGQGLKVTGQFWSTGGFKVDGAAVFNNGISVPTGNVTLAHDLTVQGGATLAAAEIGQLLVTGDAQFNNNVDVDGAVDINDTLAVGGATSLQATQAASLVVTSDFSVASNAFFMGSLNGGLNKPVIASTQGRVTRRVLTVTSTDDGQTFSVNQADVIRVPNGLMPDNRNFVLSNTGALEGDMVRLVNHSTTYAVVFRDQAATVIASLITAVDQTSWADVVFTGNAWRRIASATI